MLTKLANTFIGRVKQFPCGLSGNGSQLAVLVYRKPNIGN